MSCSASGSSNGLLGSVGQTAVDGRHADGLAAPAAWPAVSESFCRTGMATLLFGITAATDGSVASAATWSGGPVSENAFAEV